METGARLKRVIECIKKYDPERIILFGSCARGEEDRYSDLDLVIIKRTDERFLERLVAVAKLLEPELAEVDLFVYTPEEFQRMIEGGNRFVEQVLKDGKVIYEKQP
jgi:predicted nucleotidyltransferase